MDKDRGYAWVLLGASTILMSIGPSTFTSTGFLLYDESDNPISPAHQSWIVSLFYCSWTLSAFLAACFAKQRPRQLATTGAAVACAGFVSSASAVQDPTWLYLTFSLGVGFGLGIAFHTAYLVVMSSFDRYKGLANGVCQTCIAIGQITTPFIFTIVNHPKDRFHIKGLTAALGFLSTLFFVLPMQITHRQMSIVGERNRRYSNVSRRGSQGEGVPLHSGYIPGGPSNSLSVNNQGLARTRRRSQYLLAVSASILPHIPEEPESTHSTNDSQSSQSIIGMSSDSIWNEKNPGEPDTKNESNENISAEAATGKAEADMKNQHIPLRRLSEGCLPAYVGSLTEVKISGNGNGIAGSKQPQPEDSSASSQKKDVKSPTSEVTPKFRRFSESQLQSPHPAASPTKKVSPPLNPASGGRTSSKVIKTQEKQGQKKSLQQSKPGVTIGESIIDFSLLQDVHFVNMAAFSSLCLVTVVNFPIVLYFYIYNLCEDCANQANMALIIIYVVDLISRIVFSYVSDLSVISKRRTFLIGSLLVGILIAAVPLMKDLTLIYCICVLFGLCLGMLVTTEYLMFIETFGHTKFSQAFGLANLFKLVAVTILGVFILNPLGAYIYPIHPLDVAHTAKNITLICDDLGLIEGTKVTSSNIRLLLSLSVPAILCALAWITEDIYKAAQKCSVQSNKTITSSTSNTSDLP